MDEPDLSAERAFALELADTASAITTAAFGGRLSVRLKADRTPVTETDLRAERTIREAVALRFPDDDVLGEEDGLTGPGRSGRTWVIDPIDGTRNFAAGLPLWSTLIALSIAGRPVLGLVDVPLLDRRYVAVRGGGSWRNEQRVAVSDVTELKDAVVLHSSVEEWSIGDGGPGVDALLRVAEASTHTRGLSDALGHVFVADGSAEVLLERSPCGEWDWAACMVVVEEAGGRMTTLAGEPPRHGCDLLVSNGPLHASVLDLLRAKGCAPCS